jgi:hypothetical protein
MFAARMSVTAIAMMMMPMRMWMYKLGYGVVHLRTSQSSDANNQFG